MGAVVNEKLFLVLHCARSSNRVKQLEFYVFRFRFQLLTVVFHARCISIAPLQISFCSPPDVAQILIMIILTDISHFSHNTAGL